jgi:hypothetical protein
MASRDNGSGATKEEEKKIREGGGRVRVVVLVLVDDTAEVEVGLPVG